MTDITALMSTMKAAAEKAKHAGEAPVMHFDERISALNAFLLVACPANVKALVEALEKAQQRIDELENDEVRQRLANAEHQLYMAELAKHNLKASRKAQFRKRKAAEKRIAELESRTVTVALPLPCRKTADDYAAAIFEPSDIADVYNACRLECEVKFKNALTAAGIQVIEGEQENG